MWRILDFIRRHRTFTRLIRVSLFHAWQAIALRLLLEPDKLLHSVVHLLDRLVLREAEASLVRNVVDATLALRVLAMDASHLQIQLLAKVLKYDVGL